MEKLTNALHRAADPANEADIAERFEAAAREWADKCLKYRSGALLRKGLDISVAIIEFCNAQEREEN